MAYNSNWSVFVSVFNFVEMRKKKCNQKKKKKLEKKTEKKGRAVKGASESRWWLNIVYGRRSPMKVTHNRMAKKNRNTQNQDENEWMWNRVDENGW